MSLFRDEELHKKMFMMYEALIKLDGLFYDHFKGPGNPVVARHDNIMDEVRALRKEATESFDKRISNIEDALHHIDLHLEMLLKEIK